MANALDQHRCVGLKSLRLRYGFCLRGSDGARPFRVSSPNGKVALRAALDKEVFVAHLFSFQLLNTILQYYSLRRRSIPRYLEPNNSRSGAKIAYRDCLARALCRDRRDRRAAGGQPQRLQGSPRTFQRKARLPICRLDRADRNRRRRAASSRDFRVRSALDVRRAWLPLPCSGPATVRPASAGLVTYES